MLARKRGPDTFFSKNVSGPLFRDRSRSYNRAMSLLVADPEPIRHQGRLIAYEIAHRPRVTRRIHLELNERGRLRVVVPRRLSRNDIHRTLQDSAGYVARFLDEARARRAQQVPLMGTQHEGAFVFHQCHAEGLAHFQVQVVGRFVQ